MKKGIFEISKRISTILLVMVLAFNTLTVIVSAEETGEISEIEFNALVAGECIIAYGEDIMEDPAGIVWGGTGRGFAGVKGTATDLELLGLPDPWDAPTYVSHSIDSWGFISINWIEPDSKHWLMARLYSTETTAGFFIPDYEIFGVPGAPPPSKEVLLRFSGIHISSSNHKNFNIEPVSGDAVYLIIPAQISWEPDSAYLNCVILIEGEFSLTGENYLYLAVWASRESQLPGDGPMVPAAKLFRWNIEIES